MDVIGYSVLDPIGVVGEPVVDVDGFGGVGLVRDRVVVGVEVRLLDFVFVCDVRGWLWSNDVDGYLLFSVYPSTASAVMVSDGVDIVNYLLDESLFGSSMALYSAMRVGCRDALKYFAAIGDFGGDVWFVSIFCKYILEK